MSIFDPEQVGYIRDNVRSKFPDSFDIVDKVSKIVLLGYRLSKFSSVADA